MQSDPAIVEAMKLEETDVRVRPMITRAETMLRLKEYEKAREECEKIIAEYPESSWTERAKEILEEIPVSDRDGTVE